MSCKGKTGKAYTKCMESYKRMSKSTFPTFDQKKDTVVYTGGKSLGEISDRHSRRVNKVRGKVLKNKDFLFSNNVDKWGKMALVRKPNKK